MLRRNVDLPQPDGPMIETNARLGTVIVRPWTARTFVPSRSSRYSIATSVASTAWGTGAPGARRPAVVASFTAARPRLSDAASITTRFPGDGDGYDEGPAPQRPGPARPA